MKINKYLWFVLVSVLSPWIWMLLKSQTIITISIIFVSFYLYKYLLDKKISLSSKRIVIVLSVISLLYILFASFDKNLLVEYQSSLESLRRENYFFRELGKVYGNKFGLYYFNNLRRRIYEYQSNIFYALDFDTYFVSGLTGNISKSRFPLVFLPLFLLGFYHMIREFSERFLFLIFCLFLISGFLDMNNSLGLVIFYPLITSNISLGLFKIFNKK